MSDGDVRPVDDSGTVGDAPEIVLDLSRLVSRILHRTPTGVDRVEMAYARELIRRAPPRLAFGAVHPTGIYGRLPEHVVLDFLDRTEALWEGRRALPSRGVRRLATLMATLWRMRPRRVPKATGRRILLQSSPHHLHDEALTRTILRRENARFVCLVHDLIPIEYPEYARPGGAALHRLRIATVAKLATAAIANSEATRAALLPHLRDVGREVPVRVAHLGLSRDVRPSRPGPADPPYFVCLGTIEPRKNHLLLLHVWRSLSAEHGAANIPKLLIIGRRGWENEQVVDLLERSPGLVGCVEERSRVADEELDDLVAGACALLLPSFAEGFGMPVTEALALGVPVVCSDLPALREAGGDAACYLDPLDGPAWRATILALAGETSEQRAARAQSLADWRVPAWSDHITIVLDLVEEVARG
jgi:glycosyltransferase involved in cell wall biosynthesis